jgi:hypothetical protein
MKKTDEYGFWYIMHGDTKYHGLFYFDGLSIGYFYKHNRKGFYLEKYL